MRSLLLFLRQLGLGLVTWFLSCGISAIHAQSYGLDSIEPVGAFFNHVFPSAPPDGAAVSDPPATLSATGVFVDLATLTPTTGLIPYSVNAPLWTDGSRKRRWIALPNDGVNVMKIGFEADDSWSFPSGTVLVKQFDLPVDERDPAVLRRVETRFMVRGSEGDWYGVTYRWRADGSDADLLSTGLSENIDLITASGAERSQTWAYPSRADCMSCHNASAGFALGVRTHQLNRDQLYSATGRNDNQLRVWNHLGIFAPSFDEVAISSYPRSMALGDTSQPLVDRVRSYLDSNCSQCHRPGHLATTFDARFTTPLEQQNLIDGTVLYDLGVQNARVVAPQSIERSLLHRRMSALGLHQMPPLGRNQIDRAAVEVMQDWIINLPIDDGGTGNHSPVAQPDEGSTLAGVAVDLAVLVNDEDLDGDALAIESWSAPPNGSVEPLGSTGFRYTPNNGFVGTDLFSYTITDINTSVSNNASVTITVHPVINTEYSVTLLDKSNQLPNPSAASGVAIAVADMNQDGRDDIVHLDQGKTLTVDYQQGPGQTFSSINLGVISDQRQWGMCVADMDGNGFPDIISGGYYDSLHLHRANASATAYTLHDYPDGVVDTTSPTIFLQGINFADIDGDGWLDVFACHDHRESAKFRNSGSGTLVYDTSLIDTQTVPESDNSGNYGSLWTDYDNDGDLDLYITKCRSSASSSTDPRRINQLFRNDGNGVYTNVAAEAGLALGEQSWTADFADIDNDGDLDCFVGNHGARSVLMRNDGNGGFTNVTNAGGLDSLTWRVIQQVFRDFNNDGWVDLLLAGERHQLWLNDRDGTFTLASNPLASNSMESFAVGDLNSDGFPDIYAGYASLYNTPRTARPDKLFLSAPNTNGFLSVRLLGNAPNTSAIGARLELAGDWGTQTREVRSGESYGISHSATQIFGLGNAVQADSLVVRWPSGVVDALGNLSPNQFLNLREGSTQLPELANPGAQTNQIGDTIDLTLTATDATNDTLSFAALNLPPGVAMDSVSGRVSGTLTAESLGNYSVIVSVSDAWGTVSQSLVWDVLAADRPPAAVISTASPQVTAPFFVHIRFSKPVTGLELADLLVINGTASNLSGGDAAYQVTIAPDTEGSILIRLPDGVAIDQAGQPNTASPTLPVVYSFPFTAPIISDFSASSPSVTGGGTTTLVWTVDDGGTALTSLQIAPAVGSVLGQTSIAMTPTETTTYTLTATNAGGSVVAQTTVTVVPTAEQDIIGNLIAPGVVVRGQTAAPVTINYEVTVSRELHVWLQDSRSNWATAAEGSVILQPGIGTHTFDLSIDAGARVGDGYVWAMRLLPLDWASADDALSDEFGLATIESGGVLFDQLGAVVLPTTVLSPDNVTLAVPYETTERREIVIFLHDSQNGWNTIGTASTTVVPGSGTHTLTIPIERDARAGSGYVWALRLLPLGWSSADDALDADYANVTVARNTAGGATQDLLTLSTAPSTVQPAEIAQVNITYEATVRRDLGIWLHDATDNWRVIGQALVKVEPGTGQRVFEIGIVGDARIGSGYVWAIRLLPEGWLSADDALDAYYRDATVEQRNTALVNYAVLPAASATQSSTYGAAFKPNLARDANTDGDWRNGSVTHTELDVDAWWELDLGGTHQIDHLLLWNRTDCCGDRLEPYHVITSTVPFVSETLTLTLNQAGVQVFSFDAAPVPTQRIDIDGPVRYVRVQLANANYLSLAEVEAYGEAPEGVLGGVTYGYYEGTWPAMPDFGALNPLTTGTLANFDLSPSLQDEFFGFVYGGCLEVPTDGTYTFHTKSDDGSRLLLDRALLIENPALGAAEEVSASIDLTAGTHPIEVQYFNRDGNARLTVSWEGPGISKEPIPNERLRINETGVSPGFHHIGRRVAADDNADGDLLDVTAEYALGQNPYRADMENVGVHVDVGEDGASIHVWYDRPARLTEIDYQLEGIRDFDNPSPIGQQYETVESLQFGYERVHYHHLQRHPELSMASGFVRLKIVHRDWNYETATPVSGWYQTVLRPGHQTHGISLNTNPIYASTIAEAEGSHLIMTTAGELVSLLDLAAAYYIEIVSGIHEGNRLQVNVAETRNQVIALDFEADHNTLSSLPSTGLVGAQVVLRKHHTLNSMYSIEKFQGGDDPAFSDQVQFFDGSSFRSYFLLQAGGLHQWVGAEDTDLEDRGGLVIPPGSGALVKRPETDDEVSVIVTGHLRSSAFRQLLHPGYTLVAAPAPVLWAPQDRGLSFANGFIGGLDANHADQFQIWLGDSQAGANGYVGYFLLNAGTDDSRHWTRIGDLELGSVDAKLLFPGDRAFFIKVGDSGVPGYTVPALED